MFGDGIGVEAILDAYGSLREFEGRRVGADAITARAVKTIHLSGGVADNIQYQRMQQGLSYKKPNDISADKTILVVAKTIETAFELFLDSNLTDLAVKTSGLYEGCLTGIQAHYSRQQRPNRIHSLHESRAIAVNEHFVVYTCTDDPPADRFERVLKENTREVIDEIDEELWRDFCDKLRRRRVSHEEQVEKLAECFRSMAACGNVYTIENKKALRRGVRDMNSFTPAEV